MDFDDVVAALPGFTAPQREQIKTLCGVLGTSSSSAKDAKHQHAIRIYEYLCRYAVDLGHRLPGVAVALRSSAWPRFCAAAWDVREWLESTGRWDDSGMAQLYQMSARATIRECHSLAYALNIPVRVTLVLAKYSEAPTAMSVCWPGGPIQWRLMFNR